MSTVVTILFVLFFGAMITMHLRGRSSYRHGRGRGQCGHGDSGGGHGHGSRGDPAEPQRPTADEPVPEHSHGAPT